MELCRPESDGRRYGWTMNLFSNASRILQSWRTAFAFSLACGALWVASAGAAWADPPARAGRIADVTGTAWLFDPEAKAWVRVLRNQTIGQGDQMRTDARSRVTVRVGSSTVWLDEQSDMEVLQMDDAGTMLRVAAGDVALRLRTAQTAQETRIQTREGVISPEMEGLFRVDQLDRGSRLAVLQGRAQFDSDPGAPVQRAWLREGEQAEFWWAESPRIERQAVSRDKFSAWFLAQDQAEGALALGDEPYVSPEMTGAEDLNQNGNWEVAAEYGNVWIPTRVAAGWEPYRDGSWVWTRQWGWSWVDNAPWGFAPFHYGRWIQHRGRWAWAPGRFEPRPAYSPALVAWVGGPQVSVGITIGGTRRPPQAGWAPLAPRQNYVPAYPHSAQYSDRFRWDRAANNAPRNDRNDRNDRNKPEPQRGDSGPQPYRPVMGNGTGPNPNANGNTPRPWNRNDGGSAARDSSRDDGRRGDGHRDPQPAALPAQAPVQSQAFPAQPSVNVQAEQQPWRAPMPPQYNNRGNRDYRDHRENRDNDRDPRNREPIQPVQAQPQPQMQPQAQPAQNRPQVPIFNRDPGWTAPQQTQRPSVPVQAGPPVSQVQQVPQQAPQQARPVDDDKPNGKRNKRDNQDRDSR